MSFACTLHELLLLAAPAAWPSSATSQDAPRLEQLARAHDAAAIRERASTRPWSTGTELRVLLTLLQQARARGDDERASVLREELETLANELGDERWSQALRAVLHWSAAECAAYDRARGELERIESEATRERATAPPIESVLQAALDELSRVPDGARVLFGPVSTRIARVALASDDAARAFALGDVGALAGPAESAPFSQATLIGACAAAAEEFRDGDTFVWCLEAVGRAAWSRGDLASARPFHARAFDLEQALGNDSKAVARACDLSSIELGLGELTAAWNHARSAAELARTLGERGARLASTECLASVELELGQHEQALARLDALAVDLRARCGPELWPRMRARCASSSCAGTSWPTSASSPSRATRSNAHMISLSASLPPIPSCSSKCVSRSVCSKGISVTRRAPSRCSNKCNARPWSSAIRARPRGRTRTWAT